MAQLDDKSRKALHINLNNRIRSAEEEITKLTTEAVKDPETGEPTTEVKKLKFSELSGKAQKQVQYLDGRIKQFNVSLRLAFNTQWLVEQRAEDIKTLVEKIKLDFGLGVEMTDEKKKDEAKTIARLNAFTKANKCQRKGCYTGRGYTGLNVSTGEFTLCKCTMDTIDYYKLHD